MERIVKTSRKVFIKYLGIFLLLPFIGIWDGLVRRERISAQNARLHILLDMPPGINFFDKVIVHKNGHDIRIFSSACTHLGCKINALQQGALICACHGSRFSMEDGAVIKGPATEPLVRLHYEVDEKSNELIVHIKD